MWRLAFNFNNHCYNSTEMFIKHWTGCHIDVIFSKCPRREFSPLLLFMTCISKDADQGAATYGCKNRMNVSAEEMKHAFSAQIIFLTYTLTGVSG